MFAVTCVVVQKREEKLDIENFMPRNSLLLLTDFVVGVVVYTGRDTKYSLIGAGAGARARELKRMEKVASVTHHYTLSLSI